MLYLTYMFGLFDSKSEKLTKKTHKFLKKFGLLLENYVEKDLVIFG